MGDSGSECRIYVGNLPPDIRSKDVEDLFYKYGKIVFIDLKNRRGPPFAFVEFEDTRDAEDAVYARDGYDYDGYRLRVEFPKGGGGSFRGARGAGGARGGRGPPARRSQYRVVVSGLPSTGSWQDLKDHMREAGDVCFSDVFKDGSGAVEYLRHEDMKYAIKKLDDTKFRSHEGETSYVRVKEDYGGGQGGGGGGTSGRRSPSRSRSRSTRSRSPRRRSGSRESPEYSPARSSRRQHTRSKSRSKSKSASGGSGSRSASPAKSKSHS